MRDEVMVKTHLIITDVHEEYSVNWCGKMSELRPKFKNDKPIFVIVGGEGRIELNTTNMVEIEETAKKMTKPRGRQAVTTDKAFIYLIDEDDKEKVVGVVVHNHVKTYAPMYDRVGWRD